MHVLMPANFDRSMPPNVLAPVAAAQSLVDQATARLREAITQGQFGSGGKLPSEPQLSHQLGLSRATLRQAISNLEQESLVFRRQGHGTFVVQAAAALRNDLTRNLGVTDLIRISGQSPATKNVKLNFGQADARVAAGLGVLPGSPIAVLTRTRTADGRPVAMTVDHLSRDFYEPRGFRLDLLPNGLGKEQSLYQILRSHGVVIKRGVAEVLAIRANSVLRQALALPSNALLIQLSQTDFTADGKAVLYSDEYLVPDYFRIQVVRRGPG
jgi:GntR family transcriptional regulator